MRFIEKRHASGRPLEPRHLVLSVKLRAVGVRGDGSDVGLIKRALDVSCARWKGYSVMVTDARTLGSRRGHWGHPFR